MMNRIFAAQLTKEIVEIADDFICEQFAKYGDRWLTLTDNRFAWLGNTNEPVLIMYRTPGRPLDFEVNDDWFNGQV